MSQNESTPFLVTYAKNLTLIDATKENLPWWEMDFTGEGLEIRFYPFLECSSRIYKRKMARVVSGVCVI